MSPAIHDKSSNLLNGAPISTSEDRQVRCRDSSTIAQRQMVFSQGMSWTDTQQFISYKANPNTRDSVPGTVDMKSYLAWLDANGYGLNMMVQP